MIVLATLNAKYAHAAFGLRYLLANMGELREQTRNVAHSLRSLGVTPGARVAAYLPNVPEALVAMAATTGIGALWSSCSPDFGVSSVLDRFRQIEPTVLLVVDELDLILALVLFYQRLRKVSGMI